MPLYDSICKDHQQDVCLIAKDLVFSMVECWEWIEECHSWRKEAPLQSGCLAADTSALPDSRRTTVLKRFLHWPCHPGISEYFFLSKSWINLLCWLWLFPTRTLQWWCWSYILHSPSFSMRQILHLLSHSSIEFGIITVAILVFEARSDHIWMRGRSWEGFPDLTELDWLNLTENLRTRCGSDPSISRKPRPKYPASSSLLLLIGTSFLKDGQHAVLKKIETGDWAHKD